MAIGLMMVGFLCGCATSRPGIARPTGPVIIEVSDARDCIVLAIGEWQNEASSATKVELHLNEIHYLEDKSGRTIPGIQFFASEDRFEIDSKGGVWAYKPDGKTCLGRILVVRRSDFDAAFLNFHGNRAIDALWEKGKRGEILRVRRGQTVTR